MTAMTRFLEQVRKELKEETKRRLNMFDSYSTSNTNHNSQSIKINAVGGTLVKNYKDSFIVRVKSRTKGEDWIFDKEPKWPHHIKKKKCLERYGVHGDYYETYKDEDVFEPVVVLQVMLCGDGVYMVELMWEKDFENMFLPSESEVKKADE